MAFQISGSFSWLRSMRFGIAATFIIEYAVVVPAMFIIPNQVARLGSADKGGFAGSGKAKENSHVTLFSHVGRTVH